jgi:hypothetical protein
VQARRRRGGPAVRRLQAPPWAVDGEGVLLLNPPRPAFLSGSSTAFPPSGGLACRPAATWQPSGAATSGPPMGGLQFPLPQLLLLPLSSCGGQGKIPHGAAARYREEDGAASCRVAPRVWGSRAGGGDAV